MKLDAESTSYQMLKDSFAVERDELTVISLA
jgi:hypothetical protein